ncbi:MAG: hypothetical protein K2P58_03130 [Hyphomonadaceae bacterium]|nr:hypothetical protein [Hyphomonadaceae bacterium]
MVLSATTLARRIALAGVLAMSACAPSSDYGPTSQVSFVIEAPADFIALTHGGGAPLRQAPPGIATLADTPIPNALALTARVRDGAGRIVGLATELEDFPPASSPGGEAVWDTYWTVMVVGKGTLFLHQTESLGATVGRVFREAASEGRGWTGSHTESSTVGPVAGRHGEIVGGTGDFAGASGTFREIGALRSLSSDGDIEATIELRLELNRSQ